MEPASGLQLDVSATWCVSLESLFPWMHSGAEELMHL